MKIYQLKTKKILPVSIENAWEFFSNPENLSKITPSGLDFKINSVLPEKMRAGLIIIYTVKPLLNIPMTWVTEITHIEEPFYFVDEQRIGPYKMWHHEHIFRPDGNGNTVMEDVVSYVVPFGLVGRILHRLIIRKRVQEIFDYRSRVLDKLFIPSRYPEPVVDLEQLKN